MLYLLLPIAACSRVLVGSGRRYRPDLFAAAMASLFAVLPFACFLVPYIVHRELSSLINGLVILPQKRFVFTTMDMPSAGFILTGVPLIALVMMPFPRSLAASSVRERFLLVTSWALAFA